MPLRQTLTAKTDVFAFGVIMWRLVVGKVPYEGLEMRQVVQQIVAGGGLSLPEGTAGEVRMLFER